MTTDREHWWTIARDQSTSQLARLSSVPHGLHCLGQQRLGKTFSGVAAVLWVTAAILIPVVPQVAHSQAVHIIEVDVNNVAQGYRASKLMGHDVINDRNEDVGEINDIIIGSDKKTLFAVLEVGGFLGLGGKLIAVSFDQLNLNPAGTKVTLPGASKEALRALPIFKYSG
jgi:hypothetical protein